MSRLKPNNATCIVCGKEYHLCISCERNKATWKKWKMITDSENCYEIYNVLNDYNFNKISKEEARNLLKELDLTEAEIFKAEVKKMIEEINIEEVAVKKTSKK